MILVLLKGQNLLKVEIWLKVEEQRVLLEDTIAAATANGEIEERTMGVSSLEQRFGYSVPRQDESFYFSL